ncbi:hypothetical protein DRQ07_04700 [candidate division KSB1 bacterium]|nr:MAG: hypothetical protein DRQ07_04700 [candidate division KSB1 bacterium]
MAEINAEWLSSGQWIDSSAVGGHYYTYRIRAVDKVGNEGTGEVSNSVYIEGSGEIVIDNDTIDVTNDVRNGNFITGSIDTMWVRLDNREKFIRFQAVRDSLSYFSDPSSGSVRYFDSGWIVPDKLREFGWVSSTNYDSVYFVFDYSKSKNVYADENGSLLNPEPGTVELIDKNLVNGHTYLRRVSRKYYSTIHTEDLENIIPDCFPPEDIYNLKVYSVMQDAKIDNPSEGFTSFLMYLSWSKANDDASGLKRYHIYRKISLEGTYKEIVLPDDFINVSFVDTLSHLILNGISNPMVSYRVVAEDAAGNVRSIDSTDWEAVERIPGRPSMVFTTTEYPDVYPADPLQKDTIYTHEDYVELSVRNFDVSEIEKWSVLVNGVQQDPFDVIADTTLIIKLSDKEVSSVKVRGVYSGNRSSVWSKEKIVIRALSLSPENVSVSTDTNSWDGNISLQWTRPCLAARKYLVLRKTELSSWQIIGSIETEFDTIRWIDKYGIDETSNTNGDTLVVYRDYDYSVKTVNIMGDTSVAAPGNSKYCNRPPQISSNETPKIENGKYVLSIYWDRAVPSDASEGYKTVVRIYADSLEGSYEEEVVVDDTTFLYRTAVMNTNYIFRIKEVPDSPEGRQSAWSKPYIVPGLVTLPLQVIPQPRGNIYVNWYAPDLIKKYRIESYDVYRNDVKLTNLSSTATFFMDTAAGLVHGNAYTYKVNALNRMGQVVALSVKTDTCDTGSVYIPEIAAYTQKYFNKNYVTISWDWRKDGRIITGTTRGADSCMIQVSVSEYFPEDKERTVTEGPFKASPDSRTKMVNIPPLANRTNNRIYFRITSFDKFGNPGNPPLYWSSDFYNLKSAVYDTIPPYPVSTVSVDSVKAYYGGSDSIMVNLSWSGAGIQTQPEDTSISWDQLRGNVAEYRVERIINDNVELAGTIPVNKQSTVYSFTDILLNRKTEWRISSVDSAGNITVGTSFASPVFLPTPLPPEITGEKKCEVPQLTGQPDTVFYFIEIAMNPDHFSIAYELNDEEMMNRLLCRSGWINKTDFECTSGWGSIEKDTTWFRLKTGVKSGTQWWESGWSEKAFYVANQGSTNKNTGLSETTGIPENFRVGRNYPNPFNSETVIPYQLPVSSEINVSVYNISGSLVQVVESGTKNAGFHITRWNGKNSSGVSVSSGIYICVVSVRGKDGKAYQARIKLMYVK